MKLLFVDEIYARQHAAMLMKERQSGNLVILCSDKNRTFLMQKCYAMANLFIADGGEFAFGGCFVLHEKRSSYEEKCLALLKENNISYSFVHENPEACGGVIEVDSNIPSAAHDTYAYLIRADEYDRESLEKLLGEYVILHDAGNGLYGLRFKDITYHEAAEKIRKRAKTETCDCIFHIQEAF